MVARRADDRVPSLSGKEAVILDLLADGGEMYGLELVARSKRALKRGTVYVTLGRMEEKGYVVSRLEDKPAGGTGLPRRLYRPTPLGLRVRDAWSLLRSTLAWEGA
jgi:DNA-binding PadR family transcriptional regulator